MLISIVKVDLSTTVSFIFYEQEQTIHEHNARGLHKSHVKYHKIFAWST